MTAPAVPAPSYPGLGQAVVLVILVAVIQAALGILAGFLLREFALDLSLVAVIGIANALTFALVIWWGIWAARRAGMGPLPFSGAPGAVYVPLTAALIGFCIVSSEVVNGLRYVLPMPHMLVQVFEQIGSGGIAAIVTVVVIAPLVEEILFRGIILRGLAMRYRPWTAILLSSLLFTIIHLNPYQFFSTMVLGLALGWVFLRTGSLWPCIFGHAIFNGYFILAAPLLDSVVSGADQLSSDLSVVVFQPLWFDLLGIILAGAGLYGLARTFARGSRQPAF